MDHTLQAGFSRVDITPDFSVGLDGYHNEETRRSEGVRDPLYLTCIAVTEGQETILLFEADLVSVNDWLGNLMRAQVCPATGIAADKIFFGATHTHSGPAIYADDEAAERFRKLLVDAAVVVAKAALADRAPAQLRTTTQVIEGMNFNRHYKMEDGSYAGSNFGNNQLKYIAHAGESDPRMILAQFYREKKPSILLMNWQAHNDNVSQVGPRMLSSSYTGRIRDKLETETGMHMTVIMGAAGNQNPNSCIPEERHSLDYIAYGHAIADHAIMALKKLTPITGQGIVTKQVVLDAPVNHSWDEKLPQANEVYNIWKTVSHKEGSVLAKTYGFSSVYQTKHIRARATMGETTPLTLNAFRIGDLAFVTTPHDTFSDVGLYVRKHAPFETIFVMTGNARYLANRASYEYRSYEADSSLYPPGIMETAEETLVEMLKQIR